MNKNLPDITSGLNAFTELPLRWVGMEAIAIPLQIPISENQTITTNAKADVFVSLDKQDAKGIHMSRLYLKLKHTLTAHSLNGQVLSQLLNDLITSQQGLSESAKINLQFDLTLYKKALLSDEFGYQSYPITLTREYTYGKTITELSLTIPYSSTCPCSAALSRQALSDVIEQRFNDGYINKQELMHWISSEQSSVATPHSQRSYAYLKLKLNNKNLPNLPSLITEFEQVIGTPVQTAVKRADEQAFAKLNAENLMFCEDAARRLKQSLETNNNFIGYWFKVEHQESLHAHNAVVIDYNEQPYE
ncbi:GTP cyclohydrolase FolE2 [Pseudoalteromonas denitrificans]|uniref:GTP cyclohydrolase FolE2 n=1 Tax=Pseudoalteromonas denitrificans DSM 6059 TaxID=1123010 RepID=A0A1I1STY2_9GAMM|nr:GTP cyclohydrolase FolE2 [Pseudoalteromonas denitrificans]SFD49969.1 GTP cyclohydrolase I [Pseudoalteromonas denitrificans DSM 6059]